MSNFEIGLVMMLTGNYMLLYIVNQRIKRMALTSAQLEALLNNQTTQIGKIAQEQSDRFDKLTAEIKRLTDLIDVGGEITPAIEAAAANVQAALDSLDATIPDAPEPPPTPS